MALPPADDGTGLLATDDPGKPPPPPPGGVCRWCGTGMCGAGLVAGRFCPAFGGTEMEMKEF